MQNLERIEIEKQEIEKERITNLTKKLSIISKDILLPYFLRCVSLLQEIDKRITEKMY